MAYNKLIDLNLLSNFLNKIKGLIPTKVSNLENDSGYINEITSSDIITALGYTPSNTDVLPLAGGTMSGNINMGSNKVTNLLAPTANGDATSKEYVDNLITISSTQPATTQTKIWLDPADTTNSTTEIWVPTISEMNEALEEKEQAGLGISNASVGDFICVSEIDTNGKPTNWQHISLNEIICNKNLLDNWYFVGGGSQLGAGVLPINQRGQTTYSDTGICVDRWKVIHTAASVSLNSGALSVSKTSSMPSGYIAIRQEFGKLPAGVYTASVLIKSASGTFSIVAGSVSTSANRITSSNFSGAGLITVTGSLPEISDAMIAFATRDGNNSSFEVVAAKFELGAHQTLAHNEGTEENPNWVLNEIPDYGEELAKCQRYLQLIPASADYLIPFGYGIAMSTTEYRITIPLPTPMVKTPSITIDNCSLRFYQENLSSGSYISTYSAVSVIGGNAATLKYKPYVCLRFTVTGATSAKPVTMIVTGQSGSNTRSGFLLSAEG